MFGLPAAATAATIQVGSNSVAVKPQFKYVGSRVGLGSKLKFYKSLVLPRLMYVAAES